MQPIILLDLNFTLAANSEERIAKARRGNFEHFIWSIERYRLWLVDLVRDHEVVLITARDVKHEDATLAAIERQTEWRPQLCCFNPAPHAMAPHQWKRWACRETIFPRYGAPEPGHYLALESNQTTRAMYRRLGIPAVRVPDDGLEWLALPSIPSPARLFADG